MASHEGNLHDVSYLELAVPARSHDEETVTAALAACRTLGAWCDESGLVRGYFPATAENVQQSFSAAWTEITGEDCPYTTSLAGVPAHDYLSRWKRSVERVRVTRMLWIDPPEATVGRRDDVEGGTIVRIEPGMGFGTGTHPTTQALLRWIETSPARSVLDVGTGSGVLAIAALLTGADRAVGIDIDPDAVANATENRALNEVTRGLSLVCGTLDALDSTQRFDLVVANLDRRTLLETVQTITSRTRSEVGLSGLLEHERDEIVGLADAHALELADESLDLDSATNDRWWSGWFTRRVDR